MRPILFLLPVILILASCSKIELPKGTPACIKRKTKQVQKELASNEKAVVQKWTFEGKVYYYFKTDKCCDMMSELLDENCNLVCHPDGGISGGGDGKCPDFSQGTIDIEPIWESE